MRAGLLCVVAVGCACAHQPLPSGPQCPRDLDPRVEPPIVRSPQQATAAGLDRCGSSADWMATVDWEHSAVVVVSGWLDEAVVRGDRVILRTKTLQQCGGAPVDTEGGVSLLVVPPKVQRVVRRHRDARPCPRTKGPPPP